MEPVEAPQENPVRYTTRGPGQIEWVFHKTADGLRPSGKEQQIVWLMNRARTLPKGEGRWLRDLPAAENGILFFGVDTGRLVAEFDAIEPKAPAAFDRRLFEAARLHSEFMISSDQQTHDGQVTRVNDSGFVSGGGALSVFAFAQSPVQGHAALNIDWGSGANGSSFGMQEPRGHRLGLMAANGDWSNVGVAIIEESNGSTDVGPEVMTINYLRANSSSVNHYNSFIVGTVWSDGDGNGIYDPGEGIGGVTVEPDIGGFYAVTGDAGGYAIPAVNPGTYTVTFTGEALDQDYVRVVSKGAESVRLDLALDFLETELPPVVRGEAVPDFLRLEWMGSHGRQYELFRSTDLLNWSAEGLPGWYGDTGEFQFDAPAIPATGPVFFRLRVTE